MNPFPTRLKKVVNVLRGTASTNHCGGVIERLIRTLFQYPFTPPIVWMQGVFDVLWSALEVAFIMLLVTLLLIPIFLLAF